MKVLLLCAAFAAVSLAMPVAEEKVEPAASAPVAALDITSPADPKKSEPAPEINEPVKALEPEGKSAKPEENAAKAAAPAEPEAEKKPESSEPAESKPEAVNKPADELKQPGESDALIKEIPNDADAAKSAPLPEIDIVSMVNSDANIAAEPVVIDGLIPMPDRRIDLPVVPSKDEAVPAATKDDAAVPAVDPAKIEETKTEDIKPEIKNEEKAAEPAPAASAEPKPVAETSDQLRVVRDTVVDDAAKPENDEAKETEKKEVPAPILEDVKDSKPVPEAKSEEIEQPTKLIELADQHILDNAEIIQPELVKPIEPETKNAKVEGEKLEEPKEDAPKEDAPKEDAPKEEPKKEDPKMDDPKKEDPKQEDSKKEDPKKEDPKQEDLKKEDPKKDELLKDEPKPEIPPKSNHPNSSEESGESVEKKDGSSESSEEQASS